MKRLKRASDIEQLYLIMCEAVADDLKNDDFDMIGDFAKQTIENIKIQNFLSDFEKTVRDYFNDRNMPLNYETLASDIGKFI